MTRALIMAGGADEKWTSLGGEGRRHFQVICGERVIDRLIRQLRARGITDIGIICPDMPGYAIEGTYRVVPTYAEWGHEGLNGQAYWSGTERTLMVYGDMVFTDRAMDIIAGYLPQRFRMFGRHGKGHIKGGELFAFSFWPEQREVWRKAVEATFALKNRGIIRRAGSWEGYRFIAGARGRRVGVHLQYPRFFTNIVDITDDFDRPDQLEKLRALFEALHNPSEAA